MKKPKEEKMKMKKKFLVELGILMNKFGIDDENELYEETMSFCEKRLEEET